MQPIIRSATGLEINSGTKFSDANTTVFFIVTSLDSILFCRIKINKLIKNETKM